MEEKYLIKGDTFILKIKRKISEIIKKIIKVPKEKEEMSHQKSKDEILELYKDAKSNKVDINDFSIEELKMMIKLCEEEISIIKHRIDSEITETNISKRKIEYYQEKLKTSYQ